jgi:hypothetical protein
VHRTKTFTNTKTADRGKTSNAQNKLRFIPHGMPTTQAESLSQLEVVIASRRPQALGLTAPPTLLATADEVIE